MSESRSGTDERCRREVVVQVKEECKVFEKILVRAAGRTLHRVWLRSVAANAKPRSSGEAPALQPNRLCCNKQRGVYARRQADRQAHKTQSLSGC